MQKLVRLFSHLIGNGKRFPFFIVFAVKVGATKSALLWLKITGYINAKPDDHLKEFILLKV